MICHGQRVDVEIRKKVAKNEQIESFNWTGAIADIFNAFYV